MIAKRRASPRDEVNLVASIAGSSEESASRIANLSFGGAFLCHGEPLFIGQHLKITFHLPGWGELDAAALVRWKNANGAGVQFQSLSAGEIWALNAYLKTLVN